MEEIIKNEIPSDVRKEAAEATNNLFPERTKQRYQQEYDNFVKWRQNKNIHRMSEEILLAYAKGISETYFPTSLWTKIPMLNKTFV
ncbi:unnamed protein product [Ceutorhynchus assimilis]|uniref:Integrase SAM-like N-terminal domain-containing protein n=1 Tax=Ceutorhynchus assimilis TaxID=467358 RepID=A0A9N9QI52_9CUCU|nr:unnamed protein product [Ceutorhynchus assimilis]